MNNKLKTYITRIRQNSDAKTLVGNFAALGFLQVAGYVFPLITLPYLAEVIGVEKFGEIAFASVIMVYFQTLVDYGFIFSAVRDIARCRDNKEEVSRIYSVVMWSRFLLTGLAFILLVLVICLVPKFNEMRVILLLSFLLVPGHAMFPDWMFQAMEKMKYITIFNLGIKLLFTIAVFVFIKEQDDYIYQPLFTALGFLISGFISMMVIHRWGIRLYRPQLNSIKSAIKTNTDLFVNQLFPNLYNSLSIILLGFLHGQVANGLFDAGNRFNSIASGFMQIISRTFYPYLSRKMDKHKLYERINLSIATVIAIVLMVGAPFIIRIFFTEEFTSAIYAMQILSVSLIFLAATNVYGTNYLILKGYEKETRRITMKCSIIGFCAALPLVYYFSYIGAAIVITCTRGLMAAMMKYKVVLIEKNKV